MTSTYPLETHPTASSKAILGNGLPSILRAGRVKAAHGRGKSRHALIALDQLDCDPGGEAVWRNTPLLRSSLRKVASKAVKLAPTAAFLASSTRFHPGLIFSSCRRYTSRNRRRTELRTTALPNFLLTQKPTRVPPHRRRPTKSTISRPAVDRPDLKIRSNSRGALSVSNPNESAARDPCAVCDARRCGPRCWTSA